MQSHSCQPITGAREGPRAPHEFSNLMRSVGVTGDPATLFPDFVKEVQKVIFLKDLQPPSGVRSKAGFIGICSGGLCLLRLACVLSSLLRSPRVDGARVDELLADPFGLQLVALIRGLLNALVFSAEQGVLGLMMVIAQRGDAEEMAWMVRAQAKHQQHRTHVLLIEADAEGGSRDGLRARAGQGAIQGLVEGLDALLSVLLLEAQPQCGRQPLRCAPPALGRPREGPGGAEAPKEPAFAPGDDALHVALEAIWQEANLHDDLALPAAEAPDLLRLLLARPAFTLLVRLQLLGLPPEPPVLPSEGEAGKEPAHGREGGKEAHAAPPQAVCEEVAQVSPEIQNLAALWSAHRAGKDLADGPGEAARDLWAAMDAERSGAVTKEEFLEAFPRAMQGAVVERAVRLATELLPLEAAKLSQALKRRFSSATDAVLESPPEKLQPQAQWTAAEMWRTCDANVRQDWLPGWLRGRNCGLLL